jgi:hypothetical protein
MKDRITALWRGEIPLPLAFWRLALLIGSLINLLATGLMLIAIASGLPAELAILVHFLPLPYNLLVLIAVWRSAMRYQGPPALATAAQLVTALWFALMLII